jgi:hypothetical protein
MKTLLSTACFGLFLLLISCKEEKIETEAIIINDFKTDKDKLGQYKLLYSGIKPDFYCASYLTNEKKFDQGFQFSVSTFTYYDPHFVIKIGDRNFILHNENAPELAISGFANDNSLADYELKREFFLNNICGKNLSLQLEIANQIVVEDQLHFGDELCLEPLPKTENPKFIDKNLIKREGFEIQYNKDMGNKDGIMAMIIWTGTSIYDTFSEQMYRLDNPMYKIVYFGLDDGKLDFPKVAFNTIPNGAIIFIEIHRSTIRKYDAFGKVHIFKFQATQQIDGILMDE